MTAGEVKLPTQQWRRGGWVVRAADGKRARAFEALLPLTCHRCRRTIQPGQYFSRVRLPTCTYERVPYCCGCLPVVEIAEQG